MGLKHFLVSFLSKHAVESTRQPICGTVVPVAEEVCCRDHLRETSCLSRRFFPLEYLVHWPFLFTVFSQQCSKRWRKGVRLILTDAGYDRRIPLACFFFHCCINTNVVFQYSISMPVNIVWIISNINAKNEGPERCSIPSMSALSYVPLWPISKFSLLNGCLGYLLTAQERYSWKFLNKTTLVSSPVVQINVFHAIRNL